MADSETILAPPPRCEQTGLPDFGLFFEEQARRRREAERDVGGEAVDAASPPEEPLSPEDAERVALLKGLSADVLGLAAEQLRPCGVLVEPGPPLRGRPDFEQAYTQFMLINRHTGTRSDVYVMSITDSGYFLASACDPLLDHDHSDRQVTHCAASELSCEVVARVVKDAVVHVA